MIKIEPLLLLAPNQMTESIPEEKHDHGPLTFPDGFLWGAATSSHQVEGNNKLNDWWDWEMKHQPPNKRSGEACDQYNRFEEDFKLAQDLNHNAHRLSIEWSRIEPNEGEFNQAEIDHYVKVLQSLKQKNLTVMLTLHHFTTPLWLSKKGGWENGKAAFYFDRFVKLTLPHIKDYVDLWVTINEPGVYTYMGYLMGGFPPQKRNNWAALKVFWNMAQAHKKVYKTIHKQIPNAKVGIAHNAGSFSHLHHHSLLEAGAVWLSDLVMNHWFYILSGKNTHDFLGINYYFNKYLSFNGEASYPKFVDIATTKKDVTDMGWEIFPEGIFDTIMDFSDYHLPIYITENGLASTNDDRRCRFLIGYLKEIYHAIAAGAKVQGYFHWSLMDNFEWSEGFKPRFGLIEVDYKTQKRTPRPSAFVYAQIIEQNRIDHSLLRFIGHTVNASEVLDKRQICHNGVCLMGGK